MRINSVASAIVLAVLLVGCGAKNNLIGKWKYSDDANSLPPGSTSTFEFKDGGKFVIDVAATQMGMNLKVQVTGTYSQSGDTITMKGQDFTFDAGDSAQAKMVESQMQTQKQQFLDQMAKSGTGTVKWDGNDKFTISGGNGKTATFERIK